MSGKEEVKKAVREMLDEFLDESPNTMSGWQDIYKQLTDRLHALEDKYDNHLKSFEKHEHKEEHDSGSLEWVEELSALISEWDEFQKDYLQYKKDLVQDVMPGILNTPTKEDIRQMFEKALSEEYDHSEMQTVLHGEGIDMPIADIIKEIKEPVFEVIKKKIHNIYRGAFNKLAEDLKFIKDMQVKAPQGRKPGQTDYEIQREKDVKARAKVLGYYEQNTAYGDITPMLEQLMNEFDGLNSIESVRSILKK